MEKELIEFLAELFECSTERVERKLKRAQIDDVDEFVDRLSHELNRDKPKFFAL